MSTGGIRIRLKSWLTWNGRAVATQQINDRVFTRSLQNLLARGRIMQRSADIREKLDVRTCAAGRRESQKEYLTGLIVEGFEIDPFALNPQRRDKAFHRIGLAVRDGDPVLKAGGHFSLALQNCLESRLAVLHPTRLNQDVNELLNETLLRGRIEVQDDGFF